MRIAVAGFGIEGKSSYRYFSSKIPEAEIVIMDQRENLDDLPSGVRAILGSEAFSDFSDFDMVIRSAGVSPRSLKQSQLIWSNTNEFFAECPAPIIGVTGTKGKGTTSSLIASILRKAGKTVHLVGNIGVPPLDILPEIKPSDVVVFELSSFQLWDLQRSPHIAVVLMIEPDHLDVHSDFNEYIEAKSQIVAHQNADDTVIYNYNNIFSSKIAAKSNGRKVSYGSEGGAGVFVKENTFFIQNNPICSVSNMRIPGTHNLDNASAAITAVISLMPDISHEAIAEGLELFHGLPHRLKFVRTVNNISYFDDSIATTPGSAIAALRAFSEPKVIILGGSDKGASYDDVIKVVKDTNSKAVAIGQTGEIIYSLCRENDIDSIRVSGLMPNVVAAATDLANEGGVVILSPASASFDQYKNYADRGDQFIDAVNNLK